MAGSEPTLISSVQRAIRLVDAVAEEDGAVPAKKLAHKTGQPLPTTYHLLRTLVYEGYLQRVDGGYVVGDRITSIGSRSRGAVLAQRVRPTLRMLRDELGVAAYLSAYEGGEINVLDIVDSPTAPRVDLWVGFHEAGHATAIGKSILASLGDSDRLDYLSRHQLADLTPYTITDRRVLLRHLERSQPYVLDRQEYAVGTACIAVPATVSGNAGCVAVSVPARRLPELVERRSALTRAVRRVELALSIGN